MNRFFRLTSYSQSLSFYTTRSLKSQVNSNICLEKIVKRVILEFKNNDRIFLTRDVKNIFIQFYQIKHININLSDMDLRATYSGHPIDVCVLKISDLKDTWDLKRSDIKNLILINDENVNYFDILKISAKASPNLIIDKDYVFKYEPDIKTLKPMENFKTNLAYTKKHMDSYFCKNSKKLLQECF